MWQSNPSWLFPLQWPGLLWRLAAPLVVWVTWVLDGSVLWSKRLQMNTIACQILGLEKQQP
jgi:hypothetical protein